MRFLVLISLLFVLAAVAFKDPGQTSVDAVRENGSKVVDTVSDILGADHSGYPEVKPITEAGKKAVERARELHERILKNLTSANERPAGGEPPNSPAVSSDVASSTWKSPRKEPGPDSTGSVWSGGADHSSKNEGPPVTAAPVPPVERAELPTLPLTRLETMEDAGRPKARMEDISATYAEANRLLEEIR